MITSWVPPVSAVALSVVLDTEFKVDKSMGVSWLPPLLWSPLDTAVPLHFPVGEDIVSRQILFGRGWGKILSEEDFSMMIRLSFSSDDPDVATSWSTFNRFALPESWGLLLIGDLDKKWISDFTPLLFLFDPTTTVSGDEHSELGFRVGEPSGARGTMFSWSRPYCFSTLLWTYHTTLLIGDLISFTAMAWIFFSSWRFEIPEAVSYSWYSDGVLLLLGVELVLLLLGVESTFSRSDQGRGTLGRELVEIVAPQCVRKVFMIFASPMGFLWMNRIRSGMAAKYHLIARDSEASLMTYLPQVLAVWLILQYYTIQELHYINSLIIGGIISWH